MVDGESISGCLIFSELGRFSAYDSLPDWVTLSVLKTSAIMKHLQENHWVQRTPRTQQFNRCCIYSLFWNEVSANSLKSMDTFLLIPDQLFICHMKLHSFPNCYLHAFFHICPFLKLLFLTNKVTQIFFLRNSFSPSEEEKDK